MLRRPPRLRYGWVDMGDASERAREQGFAAEPKDRFGISEKDLANHPRATGGTQCRTVAGCWRKNPMHATMNNSSTPDAP